jgi:pyruvate carboxylase
MNQFFSPLALCKSKFSKKIVRFGSYLNIIFSKPAAIEIDGVAQRGAVVQLAIYSSEDRLQQHRWKAMESYEVGKPGMTPVQCYLDVEVALVLSITFLSFSCVHPCRC